MHTPSIQLRVISAPGTPSKFSQLVNLDPQSPIDSLSRHSQHSSFNSVASDRPSINGSKSSVRPPVSKKPTLVAPVKTSVERDPEAIPPEASPVNHTQISDPALSSRPKFTVMSNTRIIGRKFVVSLVKGKF